MRVFTVFTKRVHLWFAVVVVTDLLKLPPGGIVVISVDSTFGIVYLRNGI